MIYSDLISTNNNKLEPPLFSHLYDQFDIIQILFIISKSLSLPISLSLSLSALDKVKFLKSVSLSQIIQR